MSERLDTLRKARERMIEERDAHAKVLAAPFDRDKAERARNKFVEIQVLVDAWIAPSIERRSLRKEAESRRQRGAGSTEKSALVCIARSDGAPISLVERIARQLVIHG